MPKENLKDLLDGNELDLSLNNLTTVPVKDLVSLDRMKFVLQCRCWSISLVPGFVKKCNLLFKKCKELPFIFISLLYASSGNNFAPVFLPHS